MTRRKPMTLAARVAAEVMQWRVCRDLGIGSDCPVYRNYDGSWSVWHDDSDREWDPVENPADLMDVIGELRRRGLGTRIDLDTDQVYVEVTDAYSNLLGVESLTPTGRNTWQLCLARAVCRAAIEAVRADGEGGAG